MTYIVVPIKGGWKCKVTKDDGTVVETHHRTKCDAMNAGEYAIGKPRKKKWNPVLRRAE